MSVYDDIPATFPLNVDVKQRPVTYVLDISTSDKVVFTLMSLFWLAFIPLMIMIQVIGEPADRPRPAWVFPAGVTVSFAYVLIAGRYWLWRNIASCFNRVTVTLGESEVAVEQHRLFSRKRWTEPLANFIGVGIENRGTHVVDKAKVPVAAIVLKHPDDSRSIPIAIDAAKKTTARRASQRAQSLNLPELEGIMAGNSTEAYIAGTVVHNRWQALKVWLISAFLAALTAYFALSALYQYVFSTFDPAFAILAGVLLVAVLGMHIFTRRYVVSLIDDPASGGVRIKTAALVAGRHAFATGDIASVSHNEGKMQARSSVHAPWVTLRLKNGRSFIIDMQSEFVDESWFQRFPGRATGRDETDIPGA
jgi:hypothetical protein